MLLSKKARELGKKGVQPQWDERLFLFIALRGR